MQDGEKTTPMAHGGEAGGGAAGPPTKGGGESNQKLGRLRGVEVQVKVEVARVTMTVGEIASLSVANVVKPDGTVREELRSSTSSHGVSSAGLSATG